MPSTYTAVMIMIMMVIILMDTVLTGTFELIKSNSKLYQIDWILMNPFSYNSDICISIYWLFLLIHI